MAIVPTGTTLGYSGRTAANVRSITGPTQTINQIDTTHLGTSGGYREFLTGFRDGGECTFEMFYDPSEDTHKEAVGGLKHQFNLGTAIAWTLTLSDSSAITFSGILTGFEGPTVSDNEAVTISVTIKVSGAVTMPS